MSDGPERPAPPAGNDEHHCDDCQKILESDALRDIGLCGRCIRAALEGN